MVDDSYRGYRNDPYARGGAGSSEPATDPLTELARLIGQSDPFGNQNRRRAEGNENRSADWRSDAQQPAYPDQNAGYADHYDAPAGQQPQYDQQYDQYAGQAGQAGYDGAHQYAANSADQYGANGAGQYAGTGADQGYANDAQNDGGGYADPHGYHDAPYQQEPQPHYANPNGGAYDPSQQNAPPNLGPPPYFGADSHAARPDAYYDDAPAPRRRGWIVTVAALIGLAVLGTAGAFAYRAVVTGGPPPLITRDVRPDKVAPPSQNADNRQPDRLASASNEQMAPPPEQPINVAVTPQPPAPQSAVPAASAALPATPGFAAAPPRTPAAAPTAPAGPNNAAAPRKIHTVKISADQEPGGAAVAPRQITPRPGASAPRDANAPLSLSPQAISAPPAAPARNVAPSPPMRTTALAPTAQPAEAVGGGGAGYYVQLSAQKTQEEARASFRGFQAKYGSILQGHAPVFRRKDLGTKGVFYGAQVGPFSREGAAHLCEQLKSAGGSCMIQRN